MIYQITEKKLSRKEFLVMILFVALGFSSVAAIVRYFFSTKTNKLAVGTYGAGSYGVANF